MPLRHYFNAVLNPSTGAAIEGARVRLFDSSDDSLVTIYGDASSTPIETVSGVENAAVTDSDGMFSLYVDNGTYTIRFYGEDDDTLLKSIENVEISVEATYAALAASDGATLIGFEHSGSANTLMLEDALRVGLPLTPEMFGAVGDGVTDDSAELNALAIAAAAASAWIILPNNKTYAIAADNWLLLNGIKGVVGFGGQIKLTQTDGSTRSVVLKGVTAGAASNVYDLTIDGVTIDANGKNTLGFYLQNSVRCTIRNNRIMNVTGATSSGVFVKSFWNGGNEAEGNIIVGNTIVGDINAATNGQVGIVIGGGQQTAQGGYADPGEEWKATFANSAVDLYALRNIVANNVINGFYYGIGLSASKHTTVIGNICRNNTRAISLQYHCDYNLVQGNQLLENLASAVHIAYSSVGNHVVGNECYSTRCSSDSEGLFQAYVGCSSNSFIGNKALITGTGPAYYAYTAIHANRNVFKDNVFFGPVVNAYCAVESAWDTSVANTAHRANGLSSIVNSFANASSTNNEFIGNVIDPTSAKPVFFLGQVSDAGGNYALQFTAIRGNRVRGTTYSMLLELLEENSGSSSSHFFNDNDHIAGASKFTLPRGRAHFFDLTDVLFDRNATEVSFTAGDTTPSVLVGRYFKTANTGATIITDFDDGADGQEIVVRLDANTTIDYNSALIRPKGNVDAVGVANGIICFRSITGIWFEQWRSF